MSSMKLNKKIFFLISLFTAFFLSGEDASVVLKAGDTLYKISRQYKVSVRELIRYNNIEHPENLKIGAVIRIPSTYTVKKGDTLYGISKMFGLSVEDLCKFNGITPEYTIRIGEQLYVPLITKTPSLAKNDTTARQNQKSMDDNLLWPHNGKRIAINGKLKGEEILGKRGDIIISVSSGRVVWVAPYRGYGNLIMIETADKHIFAYGGNEETMVKVGDIVKPGTEIGRMGIDPIEKHAKAFFFVYKEGKPVDPRKAPRG